MGYARRFLHGLLFVVIGLGAGMARADGPAFLVENVNRAGDPLASSRPDTYMDIGGAVLFFATDVAHGRELWRSDGSREGTALVKDIFPGPASGVSTAADFAVLHGVAYFAASDDDTPLALWRSDGTAAGTYRVSTIQPTSLTAVNDRLMFMSASDLWRSDGTAAGTVQVKDFVASYVSPSLTAVGDKLFFARNDGDGGTGLWVSDGTSAGTRLVAPVPIGNPDASSVTQLVAAAGQLFFISDDAATGAELWRSDGTAAGTHLVKDINPGPAAAFFFNDDADISEPFFAPLDDALLFIANDGVSGLELWRSDGTAAGTYLVRDLAPGPGGLGGALTDDGYLSGGRDLRLVGAGRRAWLTANPDNRGARLWVTDGTAAGTVAVTTLAAADAPRSIGAVAAVGETLFFTTIDATATTLWTSDGTATGTLSHHQFAGSVWPIGPALGGVMLAADDGRTGIEPWYSDGTAAGTRSLGDLLQAEGSANPRDLTDLNGVLLFTADDGVHGRELWRSSGTPGSTALVSDINPGRADASIQSLTVAGDHAYFSADDGVHGVELWRTDGTAAGTALLADLNPGPDSAWPGRLIVVADTLYFFADDGVHGRELWRSDGTAAGTTLIADIEPGAAGSDALLYLSDANREASIGETLYFAADSTANGAALWRSDGSAAGTGVLRAIDLDGQELVPVDMKAVNDALYVFTNTYPSGAALWRSDGTDAGTVLLRKVGHVGPPIAAAGRLYFISDNYRLWSSDGTTVGTGAIPDTPAARPPAILASAGGSAFMLTAGALVRAGVGALARSGTGAFNFIGAVDERLVFSEGQPPWSHVDALWTSDGTPSGTERIQTFDAPPPRGYDPNLEQPQFTASGAYVYFSADAGAAGRELWALPLSALPDIVAGEEPAAPLPPCDSGPASQCTYVAAGRVAGSPGEQVDVDFVLHAPNEDVAGLQLDIEFAAGMQARCAANPAIDKAESLFADRPFGCTGAGTCTAIRAVVLSFANVDPIPDGAVLFTCTVTIAADAPRGTYPVSLFDVLGSSPEGLAIVVGNLDGEIIVPAPPDSASSGDTAAASSTGAAASGGCQVGGTSGTATWWPVGTALIVLLRRQRRVS